MAAEALPIPKGLRRLIEENLQPRDGTEMKKPFRIHHCDQGNGQFRLVSQQNKLNQIDEVMNQTEENQLTGSRPIVLPSEATLEFEAK